MTSRPIDNGGNANKIPKRAARGEKASADSTSKAARPSATPSSSASSSSSNSPATVAASMSTTRKLMGQGQDEVKQVDRVMVAELKSAIEAGAFKVDIGALADRLLSDVFEHPGDVEASDGSDP